MCSKSCLLQRKWMGFHMNRYFPGAVSLNCFCGCKCLTWCQIYSAECTLHWHLNSRYPIINAKTAIRTDGWIWIHFPGWLMGVPLLVVKWENSRYLKLYILLVRAKATPKTESELYWQIVDLFYCYLFKLPTLALNCSNFQKIIGTINRCGVIAAET